MKRKLGRFFARVSGVLRRVWRWFVPNAARTEVQLAPPRPDEPAPTVTREVIDLEFEEIRAALAAEPSVNAAAPEAPRRYQPRPLEVAAPEPVQTPVPAPPPEPVPEPQPIVAASPESAPEPIPEPIPEPAYKAPKYGREPKAKVKLAAPRPKPTVPPPEPKVEPEALVEPEKPIADTAVADLLARVDLFMNMGDLPTVDPESVMAVELELLVEEPTVRQQVVEQLVAEQAPVEAERASEPQPAPEPEPPVVVAETRPDPWEFIDSMRDGQPPPELVSEPVALAEVLPEPIVEAVEPTVGEPAFVAPEPVEASLSASEPVASEPIEPELVEPEVLAPIEAAPEALAAEGFELPAVEEAAVEEVLVVEPEPHAVAAVEPSVEAVMAAEEAPVAVDEPPMVHDETTVTDAPEEAELVAEAAEVVPVVEEAVAVEPSTEEPIAEVQLAEDPISDEPIAEVQLAEEPVSDEQIAEESIAEPMLDGDAEMDAELEAAMTQAEDANTAFATSHPEVAEEPVAAAPVDEDERIEDEPLSPPPVMADPYYEYAMPADEQPIAEDRPADSPMSDAPTPDVRLADDPLPPEVAAMSVEESLPPEVAAMSADETPSLADEATIDAVVSAVEETLAAVDTLDAAAEVVAEMPADADAVAAAAMADVIATAEAAEEEPATSPPPPFRNPLPKVETPTDYVATPESLHKLYQLQLDGFEGPLDLLLHLIKRHHLDIFDIPIAFICERYLEYLKAMEDVDIDVASEFLFMAAELLQLKSRMLLPRPEGEATEEEEIDPRAELVRRLLEYQKYKDVAERFGLLDRFGRDTFGREAEPTPPPEGEAPLKEVGLFALVKAFQACLDRQKPEVRHQVMLEQVSVRQRIRVLVQRFESQEPTRFEVLLEDAKRRIDIVVTFLALLEMGKLKLLRIFQSDDGVIYVHPKFDDVSLAFARLEGLDESQYAG